MPGFTGFAVGRTTFWDAVADYHAQKMSRQEAASRVAQRYREWVAIFRARSRFTYGCAVMMDGKQEVPSGVRLVVADVDGTLVTPDKVLTPRTRAVVRTIIEAGIAFTITSGRPPQGLKALIHDLDLRDPVTAFNGGLVVRPDLSIIREHLVTSKAAQSVIDVLTKHKLDVWVTVTAIGMSRRATALTWNVKSGRSSVRRPSCRHTKGSWIGLSRSSV